MTSVGDLEPNKPAAGCHRGPSEPPRRRVKRLARIVWFREGGRDEIEGANSAAIIGERGFQRFHHALLQLGGLDDAGGGTPFEEPRDDLAQTGHVELDPRPAG